MDISKLNKKEKTFLTIIFLITLIFNLYFSINTPYFTEDSSYFHLRQAEYILHNFKPLTNDPLLQGNHIYTSPLFDYLIALLSLIPFGIKIFSALTIALIPLVVYFFSRELTNNPTIALLSSITSSFLPILFYQTLNQVTPYPLVIALILYILYIFLNLEEKLNRFIIASFLLVLIHPSALMLAFTFIFYLLFTYTENIEVSKTKKEAIGFFMLLALLTTFIIFKQPLTELGLNLLTQNTPQGILDNYFTQFKITEFFYLLGFVPLIFGTIGIFAGIKHKKEIFFITNSLLLSVLLMIIFKMIPLTTGLLFLALTLTILAAHGFKKTYAFLEKTKLEISKKYLTIFLFILIISTLIFPVFATVPKLIRDKTITEEEVQTLLWIKEHSNSNASILASPIEGYYISQIAERKNIISSDYIPIKKSDQLYADVEEIYTTVFETVALKHFKKYNVDFFYISERGKEFYGITAIGYIENDDCFQKRYNTSRTEVFKIIC